MKKFGWFFIIIVIVILFKSINVKRDEQAVKEKSELQVKLEKAMESFTEEYDDLSNDDGWHVFEKIMESE